MAKKNSRFRTKQSRFSAGERVERAPREMSADQPPVADLGQHLGQQYRYVGEDLSRVGIVAALLIVVMVLLRLFVIK